MSHCRQRTGLVGTQEKYWDAYQVWQSSSARACKIALAKIEWNHSEEKREEGQQVITCYAVSISSEPQALPVPHHTGLDILCASLINLLSSGPTPLLIISPVPFPLCNYKPLQAQCSTQIPIISVSARILTSHFFSMSLFTTSPPFPLQPQCGVLSLCFSSK